MNIKTKNSSPKRIKLIAITLVAALLVAGSAAATVYISSQNNSPNQEDKSKSVDQDQGSKNTRNEQNSEKPQHKADGVDQTPDSTPTPSDTNKGSTDEYQTITPPEITEPSSEASYPIDNARYRIDQKSHQSFVVTIYAIAGPDYDRQLRDYKKDALSYLESRYGDISNLDIKWHPEAAANA